jgi:RNA polymerase sigma factor (sigma-70 family)
VSDMRTTRLESSDADLIAAVRGGDTEAYGELFGRHRDAATRLSRQLVAGLDADDLVAESFARVLVVLQAGKGPDEFFRAYLLTSIRRLHVDGIRQQKRVRTTDDDADLDRTVEFVDPAEMRFEKGAAAAAFSSLPERWQLVLWHLDVEGQKPADIAPLLGMSPNSVSALAYRAREGLRQAYLQTHLAPTLHASCRTTTGMLGAYVRKGLSARDTTRVEAHLDECSRCTGLYLELAEINSNLSGILGPALLGVAATGYLAGGAVALTGIGTLVDAALAPVKAVGATVAGAGTQGVVAAAVLVTVATAGTVAFTNDFGTSATEQAGAPSPRVSAPMPTPWTTATPKPALAATPMAVAPTEPEPIRVSPLPAPSLDPSPDPSPGSSPAPAPSLTPVEPVVPTDYALASVRVSNELLPLLQQRLTIRISADNPGRAAAETVTVTLAFRRNVQLRGVVSRGWSCGGAVPGRYLRTLTCSTTPPAGTDIAFVATMGNLLHSSGTVRVAAPGDPSPGNDSASFRAGLWPLT